MPEERTLDFIVGKDKEEREIRYRTTYFEWYIESALRSMRFFSGALNLEDPRFLEKDGHNLGLVRKSNKPHDGIICRYTRHPKSEIYAPEEMNDYNKIIEKVEFIKGSSSTLLEKGKYLILFKYIGSEKIAEKVIDESFEEFKKIANLPKNKPFKKGKVPGGYILDFGTREDNLSLTHELALQFGILIKYLEELKRITQK